MGPPSFEGLWPSLALQGPRAGQLEARTWTVMSIELVVARHFRDHISLEVAGSGGLSPLCVDGQFQQWSAATGVGGGAE